MPSEAPQPTRNRCCDIDGTQVALFSWIEQVAEDPKHGALFSRLHQQGEVIGRGPDLLYIRFRDKSQVISLSPKLVRLLPRQPDERWR